MEQTIELAPLFEHRSLGGIQVFGLAIAEHASTEADDVALHIDDREHDAITEHVVAPAFVILLDQPCGSERLVGVIREHLLQSLPRIRRVTDAEFLCDVAGKPSAFQVFNRLRRVLQLVAIKLRRLQQRAVKIRTVFGAVLIKLGTRRFRHLHADALRKILHRVDKTHAAVFHQEADGRAMRAAAKAVIKLLGRADGERWRLFGVERTAGGIVRTGTFEFHVPVDHFDDVDPAQQILNERLRNHALRLTPLLDGRRCADPDLIAEL